MHPVLVQLGGFSLSSYGAALSLAFMVGIAFGYRRAPARGVDPERVLELGIVIIVSSLVGSRLFFAATHAELFRPPQGQLLDLVNPFREEGRVRIAGLSVMGGLPAALLASWALLAWRRLRVLATMDVLAPSVALGAGIARIGCFLNGCCFGRVCTMPWGVHFPPDSLPAAVTPGFPVHPTQLYAALAGFALFAALLVFERRRPAAGAVTFALCAGMGIQRFAIEFFRHDDVPAGLPLGLTLHQVVAVVLLLAGIGGGLFCVGRRSAAAEPALPSDRLGA